MNCSRKWLQLKCGFYTVLVFWSFNTCLVTDVNRHMTGILSLRKSDSGTLQTDILFIPSATSFEKYIEIKIDEVLLRIPNLLVENSFQHIPDTSSYMPKRRVVCSKSKNRRARSMTFASSCKDASSDYLSPTFLRDLAEPPRLQKASSLKPLGILL